VVLNTKYPDGAGEAAVKLPEIELKELLVGFTFIAVGCAVGAVGQLVVEGTNLKTLLLPSAVEFKFVISALFVNAVVIKLVLVLV